MCTHSFSGMMRRESDDFCTRIITSHIRCVCVHAHYAIHYYTTTMVKSMIYVSAWVWPPSTVWHLYRYAPIRTAYPYTPLSHHVVRVRVVAPFQSYTRESCSSASPCGVYIDATQLSVKTSVRYATVNVWRRYVMALKFPNIHGYFFSDRLAVVAGGAILIIWSLERCRLLRREQKNNIIGFS
jgi:hypothetical protein